MITTINKKIKAGAIIALAFFASCQGHQKQEDVKVQKIIVLGSDTVKINKFGQVIQNK